jgi:hypothetical protein
LTAGFADARNSEATAMGGLDIGYIGRLRGIGGDHPELLFQFSPVAILEAI